MTPFYVYIAGPLSDSPPQYLANVARMASESRWCMEQGWVPINPAADLLEGLASSRTLTLETYQRRSLELLRLAALAEHRAIYVTELNHADGRESIGVRAEVEEAIRLDVPVAFTRSKLRLIAAAYKVEVVA
jgi:hypothetical protein